MPGRGTALKQFARKWMKMTTSKFPAVLHAIPPARGPHGNKGATWLSIHGWCCDHRAMLPISRAFPERDHLLADLPGHGQSPPSDDLSINTVADAVLEAARHQAGNGRFVVIGHSMGALVALAMATRAPAHIAGLVLLDPAHIIPTERACETAEAMRRTLERFPPADIIRTFARAQLRGPLDTATATAFDMLVEGMAATPADVARRTWDSVMQYDGAAALAVLSTPTLVIGSDKPVNRLADLARASPHITTGQVAAAGHMVQFEAMDQVATMIRRWLVVTGVDTVDQD